MSAQQNNAPPKWDWIPCNYNLKTDVKKKVVVWNLQPAIVLTNPNEDGPDPHVKLYIDTEKSLQYTDELGWNWHKSWNLPNISVRLEAHIFAVKAVIDQPDNFHLVDVGIRGPSKLDLVNGQAFFQAIKFFSTSYNNEGVKFHLVLCIYIMNEDEDIPKILNATISPPIFVDSRKSARGAHIMLEKKMTSFVDPFLPENLDKVFIKRENKKKNDIEINIFNNLDGLFNYLTAPNIRHKVKHPLFLTLKFSACVKLYYNTSILPGIKSEQLLESLQKRLTKDHCTVKPMNPMGNNLDDKFFILFVEESADNFKHKKINEAIESLACPSLGIIFNLNRQPPFFEEITGGTQEGVADLIATYRKCYPNLLAAAKLIRSTEMEEDDEDDEGESQSDDEEIQDSQSDEDEEAEAQPSKKVKPNPPKESNKSANKKSQKQAINANNIKNNDSGDDSEEENKIVQNKKPATASKAKQQQQQQPQFKAKMENNKESNNTNATNEQQQAQIPWNSSSGQAALQQQQAVQQQQQLTQQPVTSTNNNSNSQQTANLPVQLPNLNNPNNLPPQSQSSQQSAQQQSSQQQQQLQQLQQQQQQAAQAQQQQQQNQNQQAQNQLQQLAQNQMQQQQQQGLNSSQQQFNASQNAALNQQQQQQQQLIQANMGQQNPQQNYSAAQVAAGHNPQTVAAGLAQQQMMIPSMFPNLGMNPGMQGMNPSMQGMNPGMQGMGMMPMGFQMGHQMGHMPGLLMGQQFPGQMPFGYPFVMPGQVPQEVPQMMLQNPLAYQMWGAPQQGAQPQGNPQAPGFNPMNQGQPGQQQ